MDNTDLFAFATRNKLRFTSAQGDLNVEMLWELPLSDNKGFNLDEVAKACSKAFKEATEENFVAKTRTAEHIKLEARLEVVKRVIAVKVAEEAAAAKRAENKAELGKFVAALAEKQDGKLSKLSETALKERISALSQQA